jgi:hypothetical protein
MTPGTLRRGRTVRGTFADTWNGLPQRRTVPGAGFLSRSTECGIRLRSTPARRGTRERATRPADRTCCRSEATVHGVVSPGRRPPRRTLGPDADVIAGRHRVAHKLRVGCAPLLPAWFGRAAHRAAARTAPARGRPVRRLLLVTHSFPARIGRAARDLREEIFSRAAGNAD